MLRISLAASALIAALLASSPGVAGVQVRFVNPERYTDAGSFADSSDATLAEVRAYLLRLGERFLGPNQSLTIDVLDIDLAGHYEPWRRNFADVRIMRAATPPSFRLRYVLREKGKPTRSGEENLTDLNYQSAGFSSRRYGYEKALLDDWFRRNFEHRRDDPLRRR